MVNKEAITQRMAEMSLSQNDVAAALGITQATYSLKLSGKRPLYLDEAEKLRNLLHIGPDALATYFFA